MRIPEITIFVRHRLVNGKPCKHAGDETAKRCNCPKHLRWTANGRQFRRAAKSRTWAGAEEVKRQLEDQLSGRNLDAPGKAKTIRDAVTVWLQDKRVQGVKPDTVATLEREMNRLAAFCESVGVYAIQGLNREVITKYCATWEPLYPSSVTRSKVRERMKGFLRYCFEAEWLPRIPIVPKIRVDMPPTLPLTEAEFARLLDSIPAGLPHAQAARKRVRVRSLFLLMRWSGLAIRDALMLRRRDIQPDGHGRGFYRVVTKRQKTGTDVSVPIPAAVAEEVLATPNDNPEYVFWTGNSDPGNHTTKWQTRYIAPVFKAAGLYGGESQMVSHRLRDTFAVDLLEKGVPLEEVSKLLGHESIKTTERSYAKWVKGRQDRLDALVTATWSPV